MQYRLTFNQADCHFEESDSFSAKEKIRLAELASLTFDKWQPARPSSLGLEPEAPVEATFRRRSDGRSGAAVYEAAFAAKHSHDLTPATFILKIHTGERAPESAKRERTISALLSATGSRYFASTVIDLGAPASNDVVVYQHVKDMSSGQSPRPLEVCVNELLADPGRATELAVALSDFLDGLEHVFKNQFENSPRVVVGSGYFHKVALRLVPELIIHTKTADNFQLIERRLILECHGSQPSPNAQIELVNKDCVLRPDRWIDQSRSKWLELVAVPYDLSGAGNTGRILFSVEGFPLWVMLQPAHAARLAETLNIGVPYSLVFNTAGTEFGSTLLASGGFDNQCRLSPREFLHVLEAVGEMNTVWCHADLHSKNVLCSRIHLTAIDLAGVAEDLASTMAARLETSLWYRAIGGLGLQEKEITTILTALQSAGEHSWSGERPIVDAVYRVCRAIRKSAYRAPLQELAVAYTTQVLIHERHAITHDRPTPVQPCFVQFARCWLKRLSDLSSKSTETETASDSVVLPASRSVGSLWTKALTSEHGLVGPRAEAILSGVSKADKSYFKPLLPLQEKVLDDTEADGKNPFESTCHVVFAAPTGSGKTTLAEMFLLRPALLNTDRTCALYIAPTRALTQAKYRELRERFGNDAEVRENVIISTGEDNDFDHRLATGDFAIACLVFEKANIVFSLSPRVLRRIGCVVIDEVHMLGDLHRGPTLEMALTKLHEERRSSDFTQTRDDSKEVVRFVLITTEDKPGPAVMSFLATADPDNPLDKARQPLIYHDGKRPVPSIHHVVVAGTEPNSNQEAVRVVAFEDSEHRYLKDATLKEVQTKLHGPFETAKSQPKTKRELYNRVVEFVASRVAGKPLGYRLLVFLPGRSDVDIVAAGLLDSLGRSATQGAGNPDIDDILERIGRLEDRRLRPLLSRCIKAGIFVHHSDIERTIREETERLCSVIDTLAPPQIILATETLTYGVNLAVQDVVLMGIRFNTQDREGIRMRDPLTPCGYHNMVGRAGRIGKIIAPDAHVYVIVDRHTDPFKEVVNRYYTRSTELNSRLFVKNDLDIMVTCLDRTRTRHDEDLSTRLSLLACTTFTYPFSRAVLDGLRHLNISESRSEDGTLRKGVITDAVYGFLQRSLYGAEVFRRKATMEEELLKEGISRIIQHCSDSNLRLTVRDSSKPPRYMITPRGESVIDTGTELRTVEPLLRFVEDMRGAWKTLGRQGDLPVELYIPCLIALEEVRKQYIRYCPECKLKDAKWSPDSASANDQHVDGAIGALIAEVVGSRGVGIVPILRSILARWLPPKEVRAAYDGGVSAAVLRYFGAVLAWIDGRSLEEVHGYVESAAPGLEPDRFGAHLRGFRQFTEILHYKARCLARLLSKDDLNVISLSDEVRLYLLAARIRYGCTETAIPMFWPQSSSFTRPEASYLLSRGITPAAVLCVSASRQLLGDKGEVDTARYDGLKGDLQRFVCAELRDLKAELSAHLVGSDDVRDLMTLQLWQTTLAAFALAVETYSTSTVPDLDFDRAIRESFVKIAAESPLLSRAGLETKHRIRVEVSRDSILWVHEERASIDPGQTAVYTAKKAISFRGVILRENWSEPQLLRLLRTEIRSEHLVIVALPWLPPPEAMPPGVRQTLADRFAAGLTTSFITGAGFATVCTLIVRSLVVSPEPVLRILCKTAVDGSIPLIGIPDLYRELEGLIDWPSARMREVLLRHFEVSGKEEISEVVKVSQR